MKEDKHCTDIRVKMEQELKDYTVKQYDCGHSCRICPYPGAKCRENDAAARKIQ